MAVRCEATNKRNGKCALGNIPPAVATQEQAQLEQEPNHLNTLMVIWYTYFGKLDRIRHGGIRQLVERLVIAWQHLEHSLDVLFARANVTVRKSISHCQRNTRGKATWLTRRRAAPARQRQSSTHGSARKSCVKG